MSLKLCRVCLCTDKELRELNESLARYLQDICSYTSDFAEHLCCSDCEESLKCNLDFRNKCLNSNQILLDWRNDNTENKLPIQSLHKVLQSNLNNKRNKESDIIPSQQINENFVDLDEIKVEVIKNELADIEVVDCGTDLTVDHVTDQKVLNGSNDENNCNNEFGDETNGFIGDANESDEDDKFLIDCVKTKDAGNKRAAKKSKIKSKAREEKKPYTRSYTRKGISEYSEYASVFDIQLFTTDEEARREVLQRKVCEPYVSAAHRCAHCHAVFKYDSLLQFHMKWHDPSAEFACDICHMRFVTRKMVLNHKVKCHRGRFACKLCPLVTYYGGAMKSHFEKHQGKTYKCHCDRVFKHISSYLSHKRTSHATEHVCVSCARTFVSELGLHTHARKAHQGQCIDDSVAVRCEPCNLTFASQQVYTVHVMNTEKHRDIADTLAGCQYCGATFDDATLLKKHKRNKHPKKKDTNDIIKCKMCGASGEGRHWRWRHYVTEHPQVPYHTVTDAITHLCHHCGKRFTNITLMKDHLNVHTGARPYACAQCRAQFHSAGQLARHADTHAPPARACARCPARFRTASNLTVHMRIHTGVRRYVCDICSKSFLHAAALSGHVRGVHGHVRRVRNKRATAEQHAT